MRQITLLRGCQWCDWTTCKLVEPVPLYPFKFVKENSRLALQRLLIGRKRLQIGGTRQFLPGGLLIGAEKILPAVAFETGRAVAASSEETGHALR
jgi:hypothetical protein